jgi:predicted AAA+ superfamily ATPase
MDLLNYYYSLDIKKLKTYPRKIEPIPNSIIKGASHTGKSYLLFHYLKSLDEPYLYFDCRDFRQAQQIPFDRFIKENQITTLALDNYEGEFELPDIANIIITTQHFSDSRFELFELRGLDFEEFISFDTHTNSNHAYFNHFIKIGTLPHQHRALTLSVDIQKQYRSEFDTLEYEIFRTLIAKSASPISTIELYQELKQHIKISKDKLYKTVTKLMDASYFYQVSKLGYPNAAKKIYCYDFALIEHFSEIYFAHVLENMVFLELLKLNTELFYLDELSFLAPALGSVTISLAFINEDSFIDFCDRIYDQCKRLNITTVKVVTINYEDRLSIEAINYEAIPFWLWATSFETL